MDPKEDSMFEFATTGDVRAQARERGNLHPSVTSIEGLIDANDERGDAPQVFDNEDDQQLFLNLITDNNLV